MHDFTIKVDNFEGPLDLLLSLIEKRKLLVNDISLSKVTDDFIKHINEIPTYSLENRAQFIVIASTLLLIKSRSLLPSLSLTDDEQENINDLEERLKIYQKIKELSLHLKKLYAKDRIHFSTYRLKSTPIFSPHESITVESLMGALKEAIKRLPIKDLSPKATIKKVMSLEEMIDKLSDKIQQSLKMSFTDFSGGSLNKISKEKKVEIIVGFLAMLELVKQGIIDAIQERRFDDIKMETKNIGVPHY